MKILQKNNYLIAVYYIKIKTNLKIPSSNDQKIKQNLINLINSFKLDDANMIINK